MNRSLALLGLSLSLGRQVQASPHGHAAAQLSPIRAPSGPGPDPGLPMLPSVSRVRVETAHDRIVIVEDVDLPRGDWHSGNLDLHAAFGAPGPPLALDAVLVGLVPDERDGRATGPDDRVTTRTAPSRATGSALLLGRQQMAGVTLHVRESQLKRAYASRDRAVLRIRTLLRPPAADSTGAHDVVVRLGIADGLPMTLGRIQIVSRDATARIARAEAVLCGADADPWPLSITVFNGADSAPNAPRTQPALAPSAAVRHATDDLCIRWWTNPAQ